MVSKFVPWDLKGQHPGTLRGAAQTSRGGLAPEDFERRHPPRDFEGRRTDLKGRHTGDLESQRSFQLLLTPAIWIILS